MHGGAVLKDADDLSNRLGYNYEKKLRIALKLADTVNEGETILIESGRKLHSYRFNKIWENCTYRHMLSR